MKKVVAIIVILALLLIGGAVIFWINYTAPDEVTFPNFVGENRDVVARFAKKHGLVITYEEQYSDEHKDGIVISQSKESGTTLEENEEIMIIVSRGSIPTSVYRQHKVDELGKIPIMMYHGIHNIESSSTDYVGGNVDKDGYQRTVEAFRQDLELYYKNGFRMIRLEDYINGHIDVPMGYSPIVLTFDDGIANNIRVTGRDANGDIIIDPNSAVGILEEYKKKYPDFQVTATFFLNGGLFQQKEYNEDILKWLVNNGYDIGNHSWGHANFNISSYDNVVKEVATLYQRLDEIIPKKYINVIALPYGNPQNTHKNFPAVLGGTYQGYTYETEATLRAGWESEVSPYSKSFNKKFIKRIRAYDNNGKEFDISSTFELLETTKFISDGDPNTIVIPKTKSGQIGEKYNLKYKTY